MRKKTDAAPFIEEVADNGRTAKKFLKGEHDLTAGIAWVFARPDMSKELDYLCNIFGCYTKTGIPRAPQS